jgi:hypothetical protein
VHYEEDVWIGAQSIPLLSPRKRESGLSAARFLRRDGRTIRARRVDSRRASLQNPQASSDGTAFFTEVCSFLQECSV